VTLNITATGPTDHAVVLTGLDFHVTKRKDALQGTVLNVAEGCGEAGQFRYGKIDLGEEPPRWMSPDQLPVLQEFPETYTALTFPYKVTANDPESLQIDVTATNCDCSWTATLHWIDGPTVGSGVIDNGGRPFEVTPGQGLPSYRWARNNSGTWEATRLD